MRRHLLGHTLRAKAAEAECTVRMLDRHDAGDPAEFAPCGADAVEGDGNRLEPLMQCDVHPIGHEVKRLEGHDRLSADPQPAALLAIEI